MSLELACLAILLFFCSGKYAKRKSRFKRSDGSTSSDTTSNSFVRQHATPGHAKTRNTKTKTRLGRDTNRNRMGKTRSRDRTQMRHDKEHQQTQKLGQQEKIEQDKNQEQTQKLGQQEKTEQDKNEEQTQEPKEQELQAKKQKQN
ncbi:hypothetical protein P4O66_000691 [Electrophorus voltai]|uniref:Uncharacterized protein n=1 Tax=Electrophorus voltai TaxID=2609070 RepID=A0AAD9DYZ9_9TELE|nr:hypothetical protein P4O66_000691 [Electrophorus voltai]